MKKVLVSVSFLVTLVIIFCACQSTETTVSETAASTTTTPITIGNMPPPDYSTYDFDSYDALENSFLGKDGQSYQQGIIAQRPEMEAMFALLLQNNSIPVPKLNQERITLQERDNAIIVFSSEMHQKPWIWYHGIYKGVKFTVQFTYVSLFDSEKSDSITDVAELIEAVEPGFPNAENYENFDEYEEIVNGKITIRNEVFPCVFYNIKDYYDRVSFLYHGLYVIVYADLTQLDESFFPNFSIG